MIRPEQIKFSLGQLFDMDDEGHTYHNIKTYIDKIEQECEQLKDENALLQRVAQIFHDAPEVDYTFTDSELAEHDAEVIEREIEWLHENYPHLDGPHLGILQQRVNQLRQKAQEQNQ